MDILAQLGEFEEFGDRAARVILPESYYPVEFTVNGLEVSKVSDSRTITPPLVDETGAQLVDANGVPLELPAGASPYLDLAIKVMDGPFAEVDGAGFTYRQSLTPGKGGYTGFVVSATRAVTGQPPDQSAITKYKFQFPGDTDEKTTQQMFRTQFYLLEPEERKDFMGIFARAKLWAGRKAIVKVEHEIVDRTNDVTGEAYQATYHRVAGYFALNHAKKGLAWVKSNCYPVQQAALDEMLAAQV